MWRLLSRWNPSPANWNPKTPAALNLSIVHTCWASQELLHPIPSRCKSTSQDRLNCHSPLWTPMISVGPAKIHCRWCVIILVAFDDCACFCPCPNCSRIFEPNHTVPWLLRNNAQPMVVPTCAIAVPHWISNRWKYPNLFVWKLLVTASKNFVNKSAGFSLPKTL